MSAYRVTCAHRLVGSIGGGAVSDFEVDRG